MNFKRRYASNLQITARSMSSKTITVSFMHALHLRAFNTELFTQNHLLSHYHTFTPKHAPYFQSPWMFSTFPLPFSANSSNHFDNEISAGYSEDSDYTSDLNYPVGQHPNSSASQFRTHVITRSPETSRENSYERDDGMGHHHQYHLSQPPSTNQHHLSPGTYKRSQQVRTSIKLCACKVCYLSLFNY